MVFVEFAAKAPHFPLVKDFIQQLSTSKIGLDLWPYIVHETAHLQELLHLAIISLSRFLSGEILHQTWHYLIHFLPSKLHIFFHPTFTIWRLEITTDYVLEFPQHAFCFGGAFLPTFLSKSPSARSALSSTASEVTVCGVRVKFQTFKLCFLFLVPHSNVMIWWKKEDTLPESLSKGYC